MKKIVSLVLACILVSAMFVMPTSAAQSNVEVTAYAFETQPTFDGVITEEEWGAYTVEVKASEASTVESTTTNPLNTFVFDNDSNGAAQQLQYKLWMRWDKEYFYVAAQIEDPDGYTIQSGRANIWNGDCFQFYVDPVGANGVMINADENYDYKTTEFDFLTHKRPWSDENKVGNFGVGDVNSMGVQVYDMNNEILYFGKRATTEKKNAIAAITTAGSSSGTTTIETAIPWEAIFVFADDQFAIDETNNTSKQIGNGKVLGMSVSLLNAAYGGKYNSYLNWGSGITGAQHDEKTEYARFVNGGSNAVVLSEKSAIDNSKTVSGLPTYDSTKTEVEYKQQAIHALGGSDYNYFGSAVYSTENGFSTEIEMAPLDVCPADEQATAFGFVFGTNVLTDEEIAAGKEPGHYNIMAGYDFNTKSFVTSEWQVENGFKDATRIIKRSEEQFDWQIADLENGIPAAWHKLGVKVVDNVCTIYCDGKEVLTDTNDLYRSDSLQVICYGTGERLMDNWIFAKTSYEMGTGLTNDENSYFNYNFDTTDRAFHKGPTGIQAPNMEAVEVTCNDAEAEYYVGHNINKVLAANESSILLGCYYCDDESIREVVTPNPGYEPFNEELIAGGKPGDADDNGKVNLKDINRIIRHLAGWDVEINLGNADYDGNGKVNLIDVSKMIKDNAAGKFDA